MWLKQKNGPGSGLPSPKKFGKGKTEVDGVAAMKAADVAEREQMEAVEDQAAVLHAKLESARNARVNRWDQCSC